MLNPTRPYPRRPPRRAARRRATCLDDTIKWQFAVGIIWRDSQPAKRCLAGRPSIAALFG